MSIEPASTPDEQSFDRSPPAATAYLSPSQVFAAELSGLNQRSDWQGARQLTSSNSKFKNSVG